jgi:sugar lactone lactonase YvrE
VLGTEQSMDFEAVIDGLQLEGMSVDGDVLWVSDVFDGGIRRRTPDGRVDVFLPGRNQVGGILQNVGGAVLCSGRDGIAWFDPATGSSGMLLDTIDSEPIRGVNEMIPDGDGGLYLGVLDIESIERHAPKRPGGLYHLHVDGTVRELCGGITFANGIALSPDRRTLYCNETTVGPTAYELTEDGVGPPVLLYEQRDADGLALDADGDLWSVGYDSSEILRLAPDGTLRERIATPAPGISNIRFGGAGLRDIFITATSPEAMAEYSATGVPTTRGSRVYRARTETAGLPIPPTRFQLG